MFKGAEDWEWRGEVGGGRGYGGEELQSVTMGRDVHKSIFLPCCFRYTL